MKEVEIKYVPTERQKLAHGCPARELLYGGSLGGGKSTFLCMEAYLLCKEYRGNRGFMGRRRGNHFEATTLNTWKSCIPSELYTINYQKKIISVFTGTKNNSEIQFGGLDSQEEIDKFTSAEFGFVMVDQAEEIRESDYLALVSRLRHKLPNGRLPFYRAIFTANPRKCYLRERFILNPTKDRQFIQALPKDNPHLPEDYVNRLNELYKERPEMLKALVEGSWDILEGDNIVIRYSDANYARSVREPVIFIDKVIISCDVARYGDDETVIYGWYGSKIVKQDIYGQKDLDTTASRCLAMAKELNANTIAVDESGIGAGVVDILNKLITDRTIQIIAINSSSKADDSRYFNKRAEMWFEAAELFSNKRVSIPDDSTLVGQLSAITYGYNIGRILIDDKEDIKKSIGRSPDRADACIMGLYALKRAIPSTVRIGTNTETSTQHWIEQRQRELSGQGSTYYDIDETSSEVDNSAEIL